MTNGLEFRTASPPVRPAPTRVDIACFVGLVDYRGDPWTGEKKEKKERNDHWAWLKAHGWLTASKVNSSPYHRESAKTLLDVPVPIESWGTFNELFSWEARDVNGIDARATTYLGAAVRSFFANGGRKCYVVRVDKPLPINATRAERQALIGRLIPGFGATLGSNKSDPASWHGIGHLFGLPDVSFLCVPDLPELVSADLTRVPTDPPPSPPVPEQFVECPDPTPPSPPDNAVSRLPAPRCNDDDYQDWADAIRIAGDFIARHRREVQLVAAIPLPNMGTDADKNIYEFIATGWLFKKLGLDGGIASAFIQLTYPWIRTRGSSNLPQRLEPPDAALVGALSQNALVRGTFRSVSGISLRDVIDVDPPLPQQLINYRESELTFFDRVSLFVPTIEGITLLSDVTTSLSVDYRPAGINRLVGLLIRAARLLGEDLAFESSGERLWNRIRQGLNDLFLSLYNTGALRASTPKKAFHVRCDRTTMTQHDIDSGRVIAYVMFAPAAPIERIEVILTLDEGEQVTLTDIDMERAA